jgi:hypothetical protein
MKKVQIKNGRVYCGLPNKLTTFPDNMIVVDAPDWVHLDYEFDPSKEGDARFILPRAQEGWELDENTGTFWNPEETRKEERRSKYEVFDVETLTLLRKIALDIDVEKSKKRLKEIYDYTESVHDTKKQTKYPLEVKYPEVV